MFGAITDSYSPKQIYHLNSPGISCQLKVPAKALQSHVYYYWILRIELSEYNLEVIPDNAIDLVMSPELSQFSALYFPVAQGFSIPLTGPVIYAGTCFKATQAGECLGRELSTLKSLSPGSETTRILELSPLLESIQGCADLSAIAQEFDRFWASRIKRTHTSRKNDNPGLDHQRWLEVIEQSLGGDRLEKVATQLGLSERQFRRVSTQLFGLSPKKIQRVQRLQTAVQDLFSADTQGIENYYYDDSHRIKELKKLTGLTPGDIRKMAEIYNQST